mgnify:CR=1 FL=1
MQLEGQGGADTFNIQSTSVESATVVLGGAGNDVINVNTGQSIPGEFAFVGDKLELRIPNYQDYLPPNVDICNAQAYLQSNAQFDGLGEDFSDEPGGLRALEISLHSAALSLKERPRGS